MGTYSHSKISTFEQCPLKFKFRYIDKIKPDFEQSIEAFLGTKVHDTLEWIYNHPQKENLKLDTIIQYYIEQWQNTFIPECKITKQELTAEDYFNKGVRFLINYYQKHFPFRDNTIATEKKISLKINPYQPHQIIGYIDRLVHHKETNIFEVHDYKTGAIKSQEDLDKDRQLALYALAIREEFQEVNDVKLIWHFLDYNQELTSERTIEQLENLRNEISEKIKKIELAKEYPPIESALCNWCEYQSQCPLKQEKILEQEINISEKNKKEKFYEQNSEKEKSQKTLNRFSS